MPQRDEIPVDLPASLVEQARQIAVSKNCSVGELLREALSRYQEHEQLLNALQSGQDPAEAVDEFAQQYAVRLVHEVRAEDRERNNKAQSGARKAS